MPAYRKKPVVIDAIHYEGDFAAIDAWLDQWHDDDDGPGVWENVDGSLTVETLEGDHRASVGDWIIRGVKGEYYPVKDEIFRATYEAVG